MLEKSEYFGLRATDEGDRKISLAFTSSVTGLSLQYLMLVSLETINTGTVRHIRLLSKYRSWL